MTYKEINKESFLSLIKECKTKEEVYPKLGLKSNGFGTRTLKKFIEIFNPDLSHFTLETTPRIEKTCPKCGKLFITKIGNKERVVCSKSCASKCVDRKKHREIMKRIAKDNPPWNKGISYAPTEILKCSHCEKDFVQVISKRCSNKTKTCSKECRRKIQSINVKLQYKNGKKVYGGTTKWLVYKDIKVQGSYEYRVCKILDKWKDLLKIKNWEYTKDRIQYTDIDGNYHNYLLDFKIWNNDGSFYYLETKGYKKPNDDFKWKSVRDKGYQLEVWFEKNIKEKENNLMVLVA